MCDRLGERPAFNVGGYAAAVPTEERGGLRDTDELGYHLDYERVGIDPGRPSEGCDAATDGGCLGADSAAFAVPAAIAIDDDGTSGGGAHRRPAGNLGHAAMLAPPPAQPM